MVDKLEKIAGPFVNCTEKVMTDKGTFLFGPTGSLKDSLMSGSEMSRSRLK